MCFFLLSVLLEEMKYITSIEYKKLFENDFRHMNFFFNRFGRCKYILPSTIRCLNCLQFIFLHTLSGITAEGHIHIVSLKKTHNISRRLHYYFVLYAYLLWQSAPQCEIGCFFFFHS